MNLRFLAGMFLSLCALTAPIASAQDPAAPPASQPADGADVPVKKVVLFSSGVGYFQHSGTVKGDGSTVLRFKTDQINDILKSLLLEDLNGGRVGTVIYPSQAPLAKTLKSFEVDITNNPPLPELLNQLRGAKLDVITDKGPIDGTILGVEKKQKVISDKPVDVYVLNIRRGRMIRPILLDDVQSLEMDDAKLNSELDAALSALSQARDQEKKPVEIHFNGKGQRQVLIGYLVETPVWKTSYRLVLEPKKPAEKDKPASGGAKLQGWAIVENQTDNDWNNVELSLVSGRPISFIEDLYHSLYIPRPFVQPELFASLMPQTYQNGITKQDVDRLREQAAAQNNAAQQGQAGNAPAGGIVQGGVTNNLYAATNQGGVAAPPTPIDPTLSVVSAASASGLGELFQYTVGNVSIGRQQSAMIPIVTDDIDATKVSIYNQNVLANHPLNGVRIKNTTHKHLLQGPVTVIEAASYAGDAQIDDVPPGQQRLISYGIDLKVLVEPGDGTQQQTVQTALLDKGVLQVTWKDVSSAEYLISNRSDAERTIVFEYPRQEGWKLDEPAAADEMTPSLYRFERKVAAAKTIKLPIRTEQLRDERVELLPLDTTKLDVYLKLENVPAKVHDALAKVMAAKQALAVTQRQSEEKARQIADISTEQTRIRENMKAVASSTDYYNRLVKKLDEQETQIETWQKELDGLRKQIDSQRKELEAMVGQLTI